MDMYSLRKYNVDLYNHIKFMTNLAKKHDGSICVANDIDQSYIALGLILEHAEKEVKFYDQSMHGAIGINPRHIPKDYFYTRLTQFIQSGKKLKIIIQKEEQATDIMYQFLAGFGCDPQVDIRVANAQFKDNWADLPKKDVNFVINDRHAFKLDASARTPELPEHANAVCSFNHSEFSGKLNTVFDNNFKHCKPLHLRWGM